MQPLRIAPVAWPTYRFVGTCSLKIAYDGGMSA